MTRAKTRPLRPSDLNEAQRAELGSQVERVLERWTASKARPRDAALAVDYLEDGDPYDRIASLADGREPGLARVEAMVKAELFKALGLSTRPPGAQQRRRAFKLLDTWHSSGSPADWGGRGYLRERLRREVPGLTARQAADLHMEWAEGRERA